MSWSTIYNGIFAVDTQSAQVLTGFARFFGPVGRTPCHLPPLPLYPDLHPLRLEAERGLACGCTPEFAGVPAHRNTAKSRQVASAQKRRRGSSLRQLVRGELRHEAAPPPSVFSFEYSIAFHRAFAQRLIRALRRRDDALGHSSGVHTQNERLNRMPLYEHTFLARQDVTQAQVEALMKEFEGIITAGTRQDYQAGILGPQGPRLQGQEEPQGALRVLQYRQPAGCGRRNGTLDGHQRRTSSAS